MSLFDKLLESRWGRKFIKLFKKENKLLNAVDFAFIDALAEKQKKSKRGTKKKYLMSQLFKLCAEGFQKGKTSASAIARYVKEPFVRVAHELKGCVSHDVLSRFFIALQGIVKTLFKKLVQEMQKLEMIYHGLTQIIDGTDLPTLFRSDKDARWSYNATAKHFYFGYGFLLVIDPATHLPVAAVLTKAKKVSREECKKVLGQSLLLHPSAVIGDSEFDIIELLEDLLEKKFLLIAPYNKRNSHENLEIEFRAELYNFERQWMKEESIYRSEVEHAISTLKEHFHLLDFHVKGWKKIETHVFFVLCLRLLHGIATFKEGKNPRQVTLI